MVSSGKVQDVLTPPSSLIFSTSRERRKMLWCIVFGSKSEVFVRVDAALPAHISHALQPLDVGVFFALKERFKQYLGERTISTKRDMRNDVFVMTEIVTKAYDDTFCIRNIKRRISRFCGMASEPKHCTWTTQLPRRKLVINRKCPPPQCPVLHRTAHRASQAVQKRVWEALFWCSSSRNILREYYIWSNKQPTSCVPCYTRKKKRSASKLRTWIEQSTAKTYPESPKHIDHLNNIAEAHRIRK